MKTMRTTLLIFFFLAFVEAFAQTADIQSFKNKYVNFDRGVGADVRCVAYNPDGDILATGDTDDNIRLWDPFVFSKESPVILKHSASVNCIAFGPDGEWLAAGSDDGALRLWKRRSSHTKWDWEETQVINISNKLFGFITLNPFSNDIRSVAFNHNGGRALLACGTSGGKVFVWEYKDGEWNNQRMLEGHNSDVNSVAFSPLHPDWFASGSTDGKVYLWKLAHNGSINLMHILLEETGVNSIAFSPNGTFLASGTDAGEVTVWKMANNSYEPFLWLRELHTNSVKSVAFSPDGTVLASADANGVIGVWDAPQKTEDASLDGYSLQGHSTHGVNSIAFAHYQGEGDGEFSMAMASGSDDRHIRQWAFEKLEIAPNDIKLQQPELLISDVAFSQGGDAIYFILNARFLPVGAAGDVIYDNGSITLDIAWVPSDSWEANDTRLNTPGYFMYPLKTPAERLSALNEGGFFSSFGFATELGFATAGTKIGDFGEEASKEIGKKIVKKSAGKATGAAIGTLLGGPAGTAVGFAAGFAFDMLVSKIQYEMAQHAARLEILATSADPTILFSNPFGEEVGLSDHKDEYLCLLRKPEGWSQEMLEDTDILKITMQQKLRLMTHSDTLAPTYVVPLEYTPNLTTGIQAAPSARLMSLSDYPPFQHLPPEVQEYLLRQFGESVPTKDTMNWQIPEVTSLLPNYPNPFNPETWIPYQLSEPADVTLTIYDIQGHVVRDLELGYQRAGMYDSRSRAAHWNGRNAQGESVASGIYFYTLKAGDFAATRKMLIRK